MDSKTHDTRAERSSLLSDVSSTTTTKSPGRARRVSMKIKKGLKEGLKEVKERLSPHHHQHDRERLGRRKSGPNHSPRGPLAPVLDHLERDKLVPIHLHIDNTRTITLPRKHSCNSISHSFSTLEEPKVAMPTPEPYVAPPPPEYGEQGQEEGPDPFLVEDPKEPLSDPETTVEEPASPPASPPASLPLAPELPPAAPALAQPLENVPMQTPITEKPVPASPHGSDTGSEPDVPAVYLPQLVMPTMFLPIPNVRISSPLTWWLTRRTSAVYY
jgi:hypothetical protein